MLRQLLNINNMNVIYFEFPKAFHNGHRSMVCLKLYDLLIAGKLGEWLHDIMNVKSQATAVNGASLKKTGIVIGIP